MRYSMAFALLSLVCNKAAYPQTPRPSDWLASGGDAQRSGWERNDNQFTKSGVKDFRAVLQRQLGSGQALLPPLVVGRLISYKGFKELAFVAGSSGHMWAVDADLDLVFWERQIGVPATGSCGLTSMPAMMPAAETGPTRNALRPIHILAGDGRLYRLNPSTGEDAAPPLAFLPGGVRASNLNVVDSVAYTTTGEGCVGANTVRAIDTTTGKTASFLSKSGQILGVSGPVLGNDGTVYVQTEGQLLALAAKDLELKRYLAAPAAPATPVIFAYKSRELVVSAGKDGRLSLSDAQSLGGPDHKTPLYRTEPLSRGTIAGGLSTWEEPESNTRWVLVPVRDPGSIVAYKVEEKADKLVLTRAWSSREMESPNPPVIANGVVFALAGATLHALDGMTGQELYSTGNQVTGQSAGGLSLANGRVYFTTTDGTLWAFGPYQER